ncbi:MAG: NADH:ubiquinone oxidoreductase subunit NDUFA12 [Acetobacteraceae bacterium]|nr:NADH:ubiquinone oxidoreductase subunit NDUFA12 [Acetobacteraceae bacterium]
MSIGTRIYTWLNGREIGRDGSGNVYFEHKRPDSAGKNRRWVMFAGAVDPTAVPPEWHCWLHYTTDAALPVLHRAWQRPQVANATGTDARYHPGKPAPQSAGAYEAWTPGS